MDCRIFRFCRRGIQKFVFISLLILGFLICWCGVTLVILFVQETVLPSDDEEFSLNTVDQRRVQIIVGHYNGNLPAERRANLTEAQLNANNYSPIPGLGDNGFGVKLDKDDNFLSDITFGINQFNLVISDRIAINRTLPDVRRQQCRFKTYPLSAPSELPTTSVIIVYHNEAFSTLVRTVTSVLNHTPRKVLSEIILVDDFSTRTFLRVELDEYVVKLGAHIKILRSKERVGLIRARLIGASEARGDVLTFLDSHCECTKGWIEPLLTRIKVDRKAVVCPIIDVINDRSFAYQKGIELFRGGFNWNLQFRWYSVPPDMIKARNDPTLPIESPAMAGGLFSIHKEYFEELGAYDSKMDIWGGENIEMSLRIWQCGGRIEILPCSHVGHIFRKQSPHDFPGKSSGTVLNQNLLRVAEVWMDEWKFLFYKTAPRFVEALRMKSMVDVSDRVELRKRLQCNSFSWYLEKVWKDHFFPLPNSIFGRMVHLHSELSNITACMTWKIPRGENVKRALMDRCYSDEKFHHDQFGEARKESGRISVSQCTLGYDLWQLWLYTDEGQIKTDEHMCLSGYQSIDFKKWMVQLKECGGFDFEFWDYHAKTNRFYHRKSGYCLSQPEKLTDRLQISTFHVPTLSKCARRSIRQRWVIRQIEWLPRNYYN